jgi:hypothetical protein
MPTQSLSVIGFAPETTFGTFVAPTKFLPGTATPQDAVTVTRPTQSRGTRAQVVDVPTQLTAGIQISAELIPEVMSTLIAGWFGTGSDAVTGSAGAGFTHTLTPKNALPSYSCEYDEDIFTQVLARQVVGNLIDQFTLTLSAAQIATMQFTTVAQREITPATPGLPSNPTPAITTLQPMDFSLLAASLAGTATVRLIDATLTGANQVQRVQSSNGQLYVARLQPTQRNITFSTTFDFMSASSDPADGTGIYTFWQATKGVGGFIGAGGFQLSLVTANLIPGATNPYKVQFNLPNLRPQDQYTINSASDVLQQQLAWSVTQGAAANDINAVIVNSESAALA